MNDSSTVCRIQAILLIIKKSGLTLQSLERKNGINYNKLRRKNKTIIIFRWKKIIDSKWCNIILYI